MKNFKRIICALLTLVLSFCAINAVSADGAGKIIITNATKDKTYDIYKIFDLTLGGTNKDKVAYTVDSDWKKFFEGIGSKYLTDNSEITIDGETVKLNSITITDSEGKKIKKYINITEKNVAELAQEALNYASKEKLTVDKSQNATKDGELVFSKLELGYYLVYPKGATDIKEGSSSICSLTSTTPEVNVSVKADYPTIDKVVNDYSVEVGQVVEFTITGQVPDTTGYVTYTYKIKDTMTNGLLFNEQISNLKVTIDGEKVEFSDSMKINYVNNGFVLTFDMTKYQDKIGKEIKVVYNAKVTYEAVNSDTTKNSATLEYSNDPQDATKTTTTPAIERYVYSAKMNVLKVDGTDEKTPLKGAEFVLKKLDEDGKAWLYYQITDLVLSEDFTIAEARVSGFKWVKSIEDATIFTSGEDGYVTAESGWVKGIQGLEDGTYYLEETKAPEGYNKLIDDITVNINNEGSDEEETNEKPIIVELTEKVNNFSGTNLPTTGGIGTVLFFVIGSLLTIVSVVIFITNKRMAKEM